MMAPVVGTHDAKGVAQSLGAVEGMGAGAESPRTWFKGLRRRLSVGRWCAGLDTVALAESGLLTRGTPRVVHAVPMNGETESRLVRLAAAAEAQSDHPLGRAVIMYAERVGNFRSRATGVRSHPGQGVEAVVDGRPVRVGKALWLASQGVQFHHETEVLDALDADGNTTLVVESHGKILGFLAVAHQVAPEAASAVAALRKMGLAVVLITGGSAASAQVWATRLGIDEVMADLLPGEKEGAPGALRAEGKRVAVVGPGRCRASSLAPVTLSHPFIPEGAGKSADIPWDSACLAEAAEAIGRGRALVRTVRWNLFWTFVFIVALIFMVAGCCLDRLPGFPGGPQPIAPIGAMGLSLVMVGVRSLGESKRWH